MGAFTAFFSGKHRRKGFLKTRQVQPVFEDESEEEDSCSMPTRSPPADPKMAAAARAIAKAVSLSRSKALAESDAALHGKGYPLPKQHSERLPPQQQSLQLKHGRSASWQLSRTVSAAQATDEALLERLCSASTAQSSSFASKRTMGGKAPGAMSVLASSGSSAEAARMAGSRQLIDPVEVIAATEERISVDCMRRRSCCSASDSVSSPEAHARERRPYRGAPVPSDEAARVATYNGLELSRISDTDSRFDALAKLICSIFSMPIGGVALLDNTRAYLPSFQGLSTVEQPRHGSYCQWNLVPEKVEFMMVRNALKDARFKESPMAEQGIVFYAGAPLVASNNHRLGSLCVLDTVPRQLNGAACALLCNFAELVVRELECGYVLPADARAQLSGRAKYTWDKEGQDPLVRELDYFKQGIMFCDVSQPIWPLLYANAAFQRIAGLDDEDMRCGTWESFNLLETVEGAAWQDMQAAIQAGVSFSVTVAIVPSVKRFRTVPEYFELQFHPASNDIFATSLPESSLIPAATPPCSADHQDAPAAVDVSQYYFAFLTALGDAAPDGYQIAFMDAFSPRSVLQQSLSPADSSSSDETMLEAPNVLRLAIDVTVVTAVSERGMGQGAAKPLSPVWNIDEVKRGPLLGRGNFGRVYRGLHRGHNVAVKIVEVWNDGASFKEGLVEGAVASSLHHPNLVRTLGYGAWDITKPTSPKVQCGHGRVGGAKVLMSSWAGAHGQVAGYGELRESWLVLEYCNRGSLQHAIEAGLFRQQISQRSAPNMGSLIPTALEIALAVAYMHSKGVVHGDLCSEHILLAESPVSRRGFTAKVGNFGLARSLRGGACMSRSHGALTHCAPERMLDGTLSKTTDVYSFGVVLWELYCGERAWSGVRPGRLMSLVAVERRTQPLPRNTPSNYRALIQACCHADPTLRPSFDSVVATLKNLY